MTINRGAYIKAPHEQPIIVKIAQPPFLTFQNCLRLRRGDVFFGASHHGSVLGEPLGEMPHGFIQFPWPSLQ